LYFSIGEKIYKYENGNLKFVLTKSNYWGSLLGGRNSKDLFISTNRALGHYNGNDFQEIFTMKNTIWVNDKVITFEKDIFFFATDRSTSDYYFVRGRLK